MRRSLLFVPAVKEKYLKNAEKLPCDTLILDLEDSVADGFKDIARGNVVKAIKNKRFTQEVIVRINGPGTPDFTKDIKALKEAGLKKIIMPKVESEKDFKKVRSFEVIPIIETIKGYLNSQKIIKAAKTDTIIFGAEDFCSDFNLERGVTFENPILQRVLIDLSILSKNNGKVLIDSVYPYFKTKKDQLNLKRETEYSKMLGCSGKLVIHPNQIDTVNKVFSEKKKDRKEAKEKLKLFKKVFKEGLAVTTYKGRMIDMPEYKKALRILGKF